MNRVWSSPISASTRAPSWRPSPGEAEDYVSVRVLRESLFHCLGQIAGGGAGGIELAEEGEHLLAQGVLDQGRLVGPVGVQGVTEPFGASGDAALAAGPLEGLHDLRAGQAGGPGGGRV